MNLLLRSGGNPVSERIRLTSLICAVAFLSAACSLLLKSDTARIQGVWETRLSNKQVMVLVVDGDTFTIPDVPGFDKRYKFALDPEKTPKQFTIFNFGNNEDAYGIYELSDKLLKVAFAEKKGTPLPSTFMDKDTWVFDYKGESSNSSPVDSSYLRGVKTLNYWIQFGDILNNNDLRNSDSSFKNATTPEQFVEACNQTIKVVSGLRSQITALPVSGVDQDLISYASEYLENISLLESILKEYISIVKDARDLAIRQSSDETFVKSVIDVFLGKPGATMEAIDAEGQALQSRSLKVKEEAKRGADQSTNLETGQVKLRSSLSNRYNREFPEVKM